MKIRMIAVAALALAAACGGQGQPADGPGPQEGAGGSVDEAMGGMMVMGGGQPAVFALLGARERLSLTGPQVTVLDSINRLWAARNDTLQRQLRGEWSQSPRRSRRSFEQARPVLMAIAENNDLANRAVQSVLNEQQRATACVMQGELREQERTRSRERALPPGMRRRPGDAPFDTIPGARALRGWPWCSSAMAGNGRR